VQHVKTKLLIDGCATLQVGCNHKPGKLTICTRFATQLSAHVVLAYRLGNANLVVVLSGCIWSWRGVGTATGEPDVVAVADNFDRVDLVVLLTAQASNRPRLIHLVVFLDNQSRTRRQEPDRSIEQGTADEYARFHAKAVLREYDWEPLEELSIHYTTRLEDPPGVDLAVIDVEAKPGPNAKPFPEIELEVL
jgi:hypothetical protein